MKFTDIKQVKPHPAYWINVSRYEGWTDGDITHYCRAMGITIKDFRENIQFIYENYKPNEHQKELENHPLSDLIK